MHKNLKMRKLNQESTVFPIYFKFCTISISANRACTSITAAIYFEIHNSYMGTIQSKNIGVTVMCP